MYSLKEMAGAFALVLIAGALFNIVVCLVLTLLISLLTKIFLGFTFEPMHKAIIYVLLIVFSNTKVKMSSD